MNPTQLLECIIIALGKDYIRLRVREFNDLCDLIIADTKIKLDFGWKDFVEDIINILGKSTVQYHNYTLNVCSNSIYRLQQYNKMYNNDELPKVIEFLKIYYTKLQFKDKDYFWNKLDKNEKEHIQRIVSNLIIKLKHTDKGDYKYWIITGRLRTLYDLYGNNNINKTINESKEC